MGNESFEAAFNRVKELVQVYETNHNSYLAPDYNESQARKDFIDKFLTALGWDVNHEIQKNPYEQEVKVERPVSTGQSQRSADYACYIAPNFRDPRLFVEAKKPSKDLAAPLNCFQAVRYGWNVSTPVAVLANFEQFIILDCRYKPDIETAVDQVCQKYHYSEYNDAKKFAKIYYLISRDAVAAGSLDKYAETLPKRRGKAVQRGLFKGGWQPVDESFLEELDEYRDELARSFKNHNPKLDGETLTEITQRTLDRLVFLRFIEDKIIESKPHVSEFGGKGNPWHEFVACCRKLDHTYNGIVFKNHEVLDSPVFKVDEAQFSELCEKLSHVNSPYDFNSIPIHILGSIYERFLGKVIVVTNKRAHVEPKPEVRKAGGVYYTPDYIVRYIVDNTIGKLISGKNPTQIGEMRFADIACGSGSFLLAIFDLLLRYHRAWYNDHPDRAAKDGCIKRDDGYWHLSLKQRRRILLNNIFGVDIDHQAVEVAQMSLYLRLLEEETTASAANYQLEFNETLLPPLNKNIVCGNSLIGTDILAGQLFSDEEERNLNPMNFEDAFPFVMKGGGFDAIVGNPPYIRMEAFKPLKDYLRLRYSSYEERADLYVYFVERANRLLKAHGNFGMIISNKFLRTKYGRPLREFLRKNTSIIRVTDFAGLPVFVSATVRTLVLITARGLNTKSFLYSPPIPLQKFREVESGLSTVEHACKAIAYEVPSATLSRAVWNFPERDTERLLAKLGLNCKPLLEYCGGLIGYGIKTGLEQAFIIDEMTRADLIRRNHEAKEIIKPYLNGRDIRRYYIEYKNKYIIFTCHGIDIRKYPAVEEYLKSFKSQLQKRATKQAWYELQQPQFRYSPYFDAEKIVYPDIAKSPRFALDDIGYYGSTTTFFIGLGDIYLLALLNSRLSHFYFAANCSALEGKEESYLRFKRQYLEGFPVRDINPSDSTSKAQQDDIVAKVGSMLEARKQLAQSKTDKDKTYYKNKCEGLDRQIDQLVYELYGVTEEEIRVIERCTGQIGKLGDD